MTTTISDRKQAYLHFAAGLLFFILLINSCNSGNNYDVTTSARAFVPGVIHASYTDTPKPKYIYVLKIPSDSLVESLNNMRVLMNDFGVEMGGSRIKEYQQFFQQQINRIIQHAVQDSVKIK